MCFASLAKRFAFTYCARRTKCGTGFQIFFTSQYTTLSSMFGLLSRKKKGATMDGRAFTRLSRGRAEHLFPNANSRLQRIDQLRGPPTQYILIITAPTYPLMHASGKMMKSMVSFGVAGGKITNEKRMVTPKPAQP